MKHSPLAVYPCSIVHPTANIFALDTYSGDQAFEMEVYRWEMEDLWMADFPARPCLITRGYIPQIYDSYGFVWKCWVNIPNEIAIFHRDNDHENHWVQWGTNHFSDTPIWVKTRFNCVWPTPVLRWLDLDISLGCLDPVKFHPLEHGSLNVPIEHHPTIRYMVYKRL